MCSFCDGILKSGSGEKLSDAEVEEYLEKTVQLFSYLNDKDLFAEIYRNQLSKRLLNQRSASDDMERLMIGKLKLKCGAQFTAKMEGMLNDLSIGVDHSTSFTQYCESCEQKSSIGKVEFVVQILTTGYWPSFKQVDCNLPKVMQQCTAIFQAYYDGSTTHRRLQWVNSLGNANVKGVFNKKSYDLQVVTLQAVVLLAFNEFESTPQPFPVIMQHLEMNEDVLKRVLHSLSCGKYKVIKRSTADGEDNKSSGTIKSTDLFQVNDAFTCPMRKIRIPMASLDDTQSVKRVEEDRSIAIEASIVRIMKARKTLAHQQLIAEVLAQLAFFKPDPRVIKRRVEALIDREYLERDEENQNVYKYLA